MKVPPALLAISIGAAGLSLTACGGKAERSGPPRPVEPRLAGSVYAPCRPDPRPGDLVPEPRCAELEPSQPTPTARTQRGSSEDDRNAATLALLARGDEASVDLAIRRLERLAAEKPKDAAVLSELAAAYVVRAQRQDEPYDLVLALGAADRAVAADPALQEARFNRALTLELLFLDREAQAAWGDYLVLDPSSPWAAEAERRRAALSAAGREASWETDRVRLDRATDEKGVREIVQSHPQAAREHAEIELLGRWSDACAKGDAAGAARIARTLRLVGEALVTVSGEHLLQDTAAVLDQAASDPERWDLLVQGHREFRDGYRIYKQYDNVQALEKLEAARESLESAGSPFAARAAFYHACCKHRMDRYAEALQELRRLESRLPADRYPALRAHVGWMEGLSLGSTGRSMEAMRSWQEALALFERTGEEQNASGVRTMLGEILEELGASREAWMHGYRALRSSHGLGGESAARAFGRAADSVLQEGFPAIAIYFQDEAVRHALPAGDPVLLTDALCWRAQMRGRIDDRAGAMDDLAQARRAIGGEVDAAVRRQNLAQIAMIEGEMAADPRAAVALLTAALDVYRRSDHPLLARAAYTARARAWRRLREDDLAEADLQAGLRASEFLGEDLSREEIRLAFLNRTEKLFDEMIELQVAAKNRPDRAFFYADRARTRVLPTPRKGEASGILRNLPQPLPREEILRNLPAETTLVQFSVLEDRLFVWLVRQGRMQLLDRPVGRRQLETVARGLRSQDGGLSDLFDLLVRPWYGDVPAGESLVFVPDKLLHAVPFSALRDRRTGRYLVEDHRITVAPSATLYLNALARDRRFRERTAGLRTLAVGNPDFDRGMFPTLSDLSSAAEEGARVAGLYPGSDLLAGERADVKSFLALAPAARRIHFAGHAVVNDRNPLLSMLVFAPAAGDAGALYARDIYQLDLEDTELVVLSACSTAALPRAGSEGVTNLARAFLAAGVPSVVASLWEVDDRLTAKLSETFHRSLLAWDDPAGALREAQLSLLHDPDEMTRSPRTWGAFEVFGGSARKPFHP